MQGGDNPDTVTAWSNLAKSHLAAGRPKKAIPLYRRTLGYRLRELGAKDPSTLRARNNLAMAYQAAGRTAEAIPLLERTGRRLRAPAGPEPPGHRESAEQPGHVLPGAGQRVDGRGPALRLSERDVAMVDGRAGGRRGRRVRSR